MESTASQSSNDATKSLKQSWHQCKELFAASTPTEAWRSFQGLIDVLPIWALVLLPVLATFVVIDSSILIVPLAAVAVLFAIYATVKRAVADAIRETR